MVRENRSKPGTGTHGTRETSPLTLINVTDGAGGIVGAGVSAGVSGGKSGWPTGSA
jgi:hypothetical protein